VSITPSPEEPLTFILVLPSLPLGTTITIHPTAIYLADTSKTFIGFDFVATAS
jgi:hypothetical protein